jgi:hypothetical protein
MRPLASLRRRFGANGAMERVSHEEQTLGLGPIALGMPDSQLVK